MHGRYACILWMLLLAFAAAAGHGEENPYTVKEKETLFAIAKRIQVPVDILCRANEIKDPSRIKAGTALKIPRSHVVGKGDTLFAISRQYGVPIDGLLSFNGLADAGKIQAGDRIWLPPQADPPAAQPVKAAPAAPPQASEGPERKVVSWPHPGRKEVLRGQVIGLAFYGKQGDEVVSVTRGEVRWVGTYWGFGKAVIVQTDEGDQILYAGNESLLVNKGDAVSPGMSIARLGLNPEGIAKLSFSILTAAGRIVEPERISKG